MREKPCGLQSSFERHWAYEVQKVILTVAISVLRMEGGERRSNASYCNPASVSKTIISWG